MGTVVVRLLAVFENVLCHILAAKFNSDKRSKVGQFNFASFFSENRVST